MSTATHPELYSHDHFVARKKLFKLFGGAFHIYAPDGRLLAYSRQKAFKLREDIRVFEDEEMSSEILEIKADRLIDFSANYRVVDSRSGEFIGSLRRKGFASMFRDSWEMLDNAGVVRGRIYEESAWKAFVRRAVEAATLLLPQKFVLEVDGRVVATMAQNWNVFVPKFEVDLSHDTDGLLPRPLAVAAVVLLLAIEGRQRG